MALRVPNEGEGEMINLIVNKGSAPEDLVLRLYDNDVTYGDTDTLATYSEVNGNGYANVTLTGASWTINETDPSNAVFAQQTFTFNAAHGNVRGYTLAQTTSDILMVAEVFSDGPYNIQNNGDQIKVTPIITIADTTD